jgi:hypothetical protein
MFGFGIIELLVLAAVVAIGIVIVAFVAGGMNRRK